MIRLFVANINYDAGESDLQEFIAEKGIAAVSVKLSRSRETGESRGFAFVELRGGKDEGKRAIEILNDEPFFGRNLAVREAEDRPKQPRYDDDQRQYTHARRGR